MMDWTDRHCRMLHRTLTKRALLYTEMVTTGAVLHGDPARLLAFDAVEHPVALQIGGSEPADVAAAARIGEDLGYGEINLNVGCPSDRVQSGRFGACLMREPQRVAECMAAAIAAVAIPATVKCRIGVDDQDPEDSLFGLVDLCAQAGVDTFIVHARKAWLDGLSPKENRDIPPLDYGLVHRLKAERPGLTIMHQRRAEVAGGRRGAHIDQGLDGAMLGRAAYHEPGILGEADRLLFDPAAPVVTPEEAVRAYRPHLAAGTGPGNPPLGRHGAPHARPVPWPPRRAQAWRRILTVEGVKAGSGVGGGRQGPGGCDRGSSRGASRRWSGTSSSGRPLGAA